MAEALQSNHTSSFPDLLNQAKASLVVSTYQAGKLILLRSQGQSLNTHFVSLPKPMGVAFSQGRLSIGSGFNVIDYFNLSNVGPKVPPANTHDAAFLPRRTHVTGDIDIHEMGFDYQQQLWIVNTKMSCLCTLDINHSIVPQWRPPFITGYDLTDRCHLNGLAFRDGKPRYVSALGTSDKPAGWRKNKAFGGMVMDIESNEMIAEGLSMPHSPRWYRNKLWVLESGAGQLITIDPGTGEKTVVVEVPGFCRGFDFIERYALIGLSEVRETAVFAGLPLTEREQDRKCGVWIVNIETGKTVGYLVFSDGVQEIFSVQVIPNKYPALLDMNDPLLRTSYSIPEQALKEFTPPNPKQIRIEQAIRLHRQRKLDEAKTAYQEILADDPDNVQVLYHLSTALIETQHWDQAIEKLGRVLSLQPNHAEAHNNLGHAWSGKQDSDKAMRAFEDAIGADQKYAAAHVNRGLLLLKNGQYKEGWQELEWRWRMPGNRPINCPQPQWKGEDIADKTLLVYTERGQGDALQFARFLPLAKEKCQKLIVVCSEPLRLLFKEMACVDEVRLSGNLPRDLFDLYAPIMSLPLALDITIENLPSTTPYLSISQQVVVPNLGKNNKPKIGIAWAGSPLLKQNAQRSCPLDNMLKLVDGLNAEFYSFQLPISSEQKEQLAKHDVTNLETELVSFAHTGALMQQMDFMVSVCTSALHLAGALNIQTIGLLANNADWRWGVDEAQSRWYPNTTLIRQTQAGQWDKVIDACQRYLAKQLKSKL